MSCLCGDRPGCGGRLCLSCRAMLKKYPVLRYPKDEFGSPDLGKEPKKGWVCAMVSDTNAGGGKRSTLSVPGQVRGTDTEGVKCMTVSAGSMDKPAAIGDRVIIKDKTYRVTSVGGEVYSKAELLLCL